MQDFGQDTLFGKKTISSINYNEQEIIRDILYLHAGGADIDCDPTYSTGQFYKDWAMKPRHKFDKHPQIPGVTKASSHNLPLSAETIKVLMFDPPFVISGQGYNAPGEGTGKISGRFTAFKDFRELKDMYSASLKEFMRILVPGGIVIFKCQDQVCSQLNHFIHCWIMGEAIKIGFYPRDLFILLAKNRITDGRQQQHARKYHAYFWVLQKTTCRVDY